MRLAGVIPGNHLALLRMPDTATSLGWAIGSGIHTPYLDQLGGVGRDSAEDRICVDGDDCVDL